MKKSRNFPFDFVLNQLHSLDPTVRPMFGCHAVYVKEKMVLVCRENKNNKDVDNGVWVVTSKEHHESLRKEIPSLQRITLLGNKETQGQNILSAGVL